MRYLSVCSGIEAATVAWHGMAWQPVGFSEIDKFPSAVLAHHYPSVPNFGDMTKFKEWPDANVDVLVGGTPCQSFSVAGLRKGLDDPRGNLMLTYLAIADKYRPRWLVWENVPGVLSSNGGRDFASFLRGLAELGYGFAYRILDAQFFGVAQRRRRVFVVGCIGDWRRAAAVLFERHSLQGHPAPRREAGKGVAASLRTRAAGGGGQGSDCVANTLTAHTGIKQPDFANYMPWPQSVAPALDTTMQKYQGLDNQHINGGGAGSFPQVSLCLNAGAMGRQDWETETLIPTLGGRFDVAGAICKDSFSGGAGGRPEGAAGNHFIAIPGNVINRKPENGGNAVEPMHNLSPNLTSTDRYAVSTPMQVRRLTPVECERLQGFPDGYTQVPYHGKPAADGPRYKALGNSMAVPVMRWIGQRIQQVENIDGA